MGLPSPAVFAHLLDRLFGFPAEDFFSVGGVGEAFGHIAGAALYDLVGDFFAGGLLESFDHVEHRVAVAGAEVDGEYPFVLCQVLQGFEVAAGEVHDVDVVADPRAVVGVVVAAEDAEAVAFTDGGLGNERHEVVGNAVGVFANGARLVRTDGVEIAQQSDAPRLVRKGEVPQDLFDEELRLAVGVGSAERKVLGYRGGVRVAVDGGGRAEDNVFTAVLLHDLAEYQCAMDVVVVVAQRLLDRLADGLEAGKVDDGRDVVAAKDLLHVLRRADVAFDKRDALADDLFDPSKALFRGVGKVVEHHHFVPGFY